MSSSVKRVRRQSQLQPIWRNCSRMRASYLSFHCQMRSTSSSRPSSWRSRFSSSLQPAFDDGLRGDAGVVGAGHPEGVVALHPLEADDDVLQRVVEGVAEVEGAGDVRRRDDDGEGALVGRMPTPSRGHGTRDTLTLPSPRGRGFSSATNGRGFMCGRWIAVEVAVRFPEFVPALLGGGVIVLLGKLVGGEGSGGHIFIIFKATALRSADARQPCSLAQFCPGFFSGDKSMTRCEFLGKNERQCQVLSKAASFWYESFCDLS